MNLLHQWEQYIDMDLYMDLSDRVFFLRNGKEIVVFDDHSLKFMATEKNLEIWISQYYMGLIRLPSDMDNETKKAMKRKIYDAIKVSLLLANQYAVLSYRRDPWSDSPQIVRDDHKLEYIAPGMYIKPYNDPFLIDKIEMNIIVEDYRAHFPQFDEFLDWLIACRFTSNRRTSYTYLRVSAGFGKSFLASIFEDLGTGRKIVQQQLKHNSASDLSPADFRNSFILMIDEFTHFAQELKDLTHGMYLSAKYQLTEYVPLYAKVFLSAEKSTSFFGEAGVDEQLADRVSIIDLSGAGKLENRKLYKQNTKKYHEAIKKYVYMFFMDRIKYYTEAGELEANVAANKILDKHFRKYRIQSTAIEKIREKCVEYLREYIDWHQSVTLGIGDSEHRPRNTFCERLDRVVAVKNEDEIVAKDMVKMYELLIAEAGDQFRKSAKFKQTALDEVFKTNLQKRQYKCQGKNVRGVLINIAKLDRKIPVVVEDADGSVIDEYEEVPY